MYIYIYIYISWTHCSIPIFSLKLHYFMHLVVNICYVISIMNDCGIDREISKVESSFECKNRILKRCP